MEIIKLYLKLKNITKVEQNYILENDEYDEKKIRNMIIEKRIIRDKIEKFQKKSKISEKDLDKVKKIIEEIIKLEKKNQKIYIEKMNMLKDNIGSTIKEKQLKNTYFKKGIVLNVIDKKQ